VKGHAQHPWNDRADELADKGTRTQQKQRAGEKPSPGASSSQSSSSSSSSSFSAPPTGRRAVVRAVVSLSGGGGGLGVRGLRTGLRLLLPLMRVAV
jgi:hypothetical protein